MMMRYRDKKRISIRRKVLVVSVLIAVYVLGFTSFPGMISNGVHMAGIPVWKIGGEFSETGSAITGLFGSKAQLKEENNKLKDQLRQMSMLVSDRNALLLDNAELKKILSRDTSQEMVLSVVLARPDRTPYDSIIIDVGDSHGVSAGDYVVAESIIIGEIQKVYGHTSKVVLFSSSGREQEVLLGEETVAVTATGLGGGNFIIQLPRDIEASIGDAVLFAHISPVIMGSVEFIDMLPNDPFKHLRFTSPVNMQTIKYVGVIPGRGISDEAYE